MLLVCDSRIVNKRKLAGFACWKDRSLEPSMSALRNTTLAVRTYTKDFETPLWSVNLQ